jgi:hypothetical protein
VVAFELVGLGLGRTAHPGGPITYELVAQDALALIEAIG